MATLVTAERAATAVTGGMPAPVDVAGYWPASTPTPAMAVAAVPAVPGAPMAPPAAATQAAPAPVTLTAQTAGQAATASAGTRLTAVAAPTATPANYQPFQCVTLSAGSRLAGRKSMPCV
ncbi:Uncharacterised protein [Mycobacterium tuberculosis]|nr:Uncharacterised protein [Mycobacterium tuberculosis]CKS51101.1 Uncharacterised protein [Mycobacterium tuberculosis]CNM98316.1 Uncharacterised protein [Mycobacterium tuberculosis]CNN36488.1 Uncharacterised protein [Mycobacterium tuberculosis]CNN36942.1 Uncharacterised protein [Mycobacterium tuberculosis]